MNTIQRCPECGAPWPDGVTCQEHFYQIGYWENEHPASTLEVHHLMVLCYHLQHPSLYSPEGLREAMRLLSDFLERGMTTEQVRQRNRAVMDSGKRKFKIKGTPGTRGAYTHSIQWTMTAADILEGGVDHYCDNVRAWARSVLEALKTSGNLS